MLASGQPPPPWAVGVVVPVGAELAFDLLLDHNHSSTCNWQTSIYNME